MGIILVEGTLFKKQQMVSRRLLSSGAPDCSLGSNVNQCLMVLMCKVKKDVKRLTHVLERQMGITRDFDAKIILEKK
ncbi:hypothetical protein H920_08931 [Fukomys damarensis]|uniref:Uncharacterized protein n=1 Tax=Fukomys damarensis TaxID=885580 RepID=A0A091E3Y3_FUKDA|nr:hypothetical protein H920_08931 [Fukomys damarensis]